MKRVAPVIVLAGILGLIACGSPTGPSHSAPPTESGGGVSPLPSVNGEITVAAVLPESGAVVPVFNCDSTALLGGNRTAHFEGICSNQLRMTFDVLIDQDTPDGYLSVMFVDRYTTCGQMFSPRISLTANSLTSITAGTVMLSGHQGHPGLESPCPLPATTTRLIVSLLGSRGGVLITREFVHGYTFAMRE